MSPEYWWEEVYYWLPHSGCLRPALPSGKSSCDKAHCTARAPLRAYRGVQREARY